MRGDPVDEVSEVSAGGWENDGTEEIDEDDESHGETAETTHFFEPDQFCQVVDRGVDPSSSLGEQNAPCFGCGGAGVRIWDEFVGHVGEVFRH